jgi:broad specificity phosphatase PhoE
MSELILVRHGQASFGAESYDKLSDKGVEQVKILSQHWQALGERFDHIYSGTLLRQRETAQELLPLVDGEPTASVQLTGFNEYNGDPLIRAHLRDMREAGDLSGPAQWPIQDERLFQKIFEKATARWIVDDLDPRDDIADFERWSDFKARVYAALDEVMARHGSGSRVIVSTSGGVIAMALQRVLNFPDDQVIATNWMVRNSAVSRIIYGRGKLSLTQFNNLAHLETPEKQQLITFR